ncbi:MAG: 7,8-didemethyl-8-hydroxy-5-deazariboflavin synthase subunit CofG [Cyanobacteria bacterium J06642_2]
MTASPHCSPQETAASDRFPRTITFSAAYTLVPTYECFNRCTYCNFRVEPGAEWLSLAAARQELEAIRDRGVCEILVLSGEVHPRSSRRAQLIERIYNICELALELGFLPHTNAGPLSEAEMQRLKSVNASMGLMVEQVSDRLLDTVHRRAPSKVPALRLAQLEQAGRLQIPFTTGILVGVGETIVERQESLQAISAVHARYGHIQEIIVQPYRQGSGQVSNQADARGDELVETVRLARQILPEDVAIQIPPNLTDELKPCLQAGATDLGGISPVDVVNPDYPHPTVRALTARLAPNYILRRRLPLYPHHFDWVSARVRPVLERWQDA